MRIFPSSRLKADRSGLSVAMTPENSLTDCWNRVSNCAYVSVCQFQDGFFCSQVPSQAAETGNALPTVTPLVVVVAARPARLAPRSSPYHSRWPCVVSWPCQIFLHHRGVLLGDDAAWRHQADELAGVPVAGARVGDDAVGAAAGLHGRLGEGVLLAGGQEVVRLVHDELGPDLRRDELGPVDRRGRRTRCRCSRTGTSAPPSGPPGPRWSSR